VAARLLIVDDSAVIRRILQSLVKDDPEIEVVGTAANGELAIEKIKRLEPDIVTLDIEMPVMDGLTALAEIRKFNRTMPILMCSTLTSRGAEATLEALSRGATDYVPKPTGTPRGDDAFAVIRDELLTKIKTLAGGGARRPRQTERPRFGDDAAATPTAGPTSWPTRPERVGPVEAVVLGCSTGGPAALDVVMTSIKQPLPVPVFVVQHMPPVFTQLLAERLNDKCPMTVVEADDGMVAAPGHVYVAPGGRHLVVERHGTEVVCATNTDPPVNFCRPAVDVLFRSAVQVYGARALGVIMTGMGRDGYEGCKDIVAAGGEAYVEHPDTCVVWGMPREVTEDGLASRIVRLGDMGNAIAGRLGALATASAGGPR
jgi:two-component system chemotaxis response regulator CheB